MEKIHKKGNIFMTEKRVRKPDRRVAKTKKSIRKAFMKLLLSKEYEKITIKDIAFEADVDRKTVYNYYNGIHEIRDELENEMINSIDDVIAGIDFGDTYNQTKKLFGTITDMITNNLELSSYIFSDDANSKIVRKISNDIEIKVNKLMRNTELNTLDDFMINVISSFYAFGIMAAYQRWINEKMSVPFDKMSEVMCKLVLDGVIAFIK